MKLAELQPEIESLFGADVHLISAPAPSVSVIDDTVRIAGIRKYISTDVLVQLVEILNIPDNYARVVAKRNRDLLLAMIRDSLSHSRRELSFLFSGPDVVTVLSGNADSIRDVFRVVIGTLSSLYGDSGAVVNVTLGSTFCMTVAIAEQAKIFPALQIEITKSSALRVAPRAVFLGGGCLADHRSDGSSFRRPHPQDFELEEIFQLASFYADELVCLYEERKGNLVSDPIKALLVSGGNAEYASKVVLGLKGQRIDVLGPLVEAAAKVARTYREIRIPLALLRGD